jgi:polysaccharide export outer membrane protein
MPFRVAEGDVLNIDIVLKGSLGDLSKLSMGIPLEIVGESIYSHHSVTVTPDGFIYLPGMAPLRVKNATPSEVQFDITAALHLPANQNLVSVALARTSSQAFHVWGEVKQPGRHLMDHPLNVMEAISLAGGPTEHAKLKKVLLLRKGCPAQQIDLSVDTLEADGGSEVPLEPSDTVIVPRRWTVSEFFILALLTAISTGSAVYVASKTN